MTSVVRVYPSQIQLHNWLSENKSNKLGNPADTTLNGVSRRGSVLQISPEDNKPQGPLNSAKSRSWTTRTTLPESGC